MTEEKTGVFVMPDSEAKPEEGVAYFVILSGDDAGTILKLVEGEYSVGRGRDTNIRVRGDGVSRVHAKVLVYGDGTVHVSDAGSTNGTYVDGERIEGEWVDDGSHIQFGSVAVLKFSREEDAEERFDQQLYRSTTQAMTGVYNAQYFNEQLEKDFSHAVRHSSSLSLVLFSIDALDTVIQKRGPQMGDALVRWAARMIADAIRREDVLCRIDDNRFGVLMRDCPSRSSFLFAQRIQQQVQSGSFRSANQSMSVTISVGAVTLKRAIHNDAPTLLADAERYLARAIARGRNRVEGSFQEG